MSKVRGAIKLIVALAIPTGLAAGFYFSQKEADRQLEEQQKYQKEHPATKQITVDNYELKEIDDSNQMKWHLVAKQGTMEPTTRDVDLDQVQVQFFEGPKVKMSLSAAKGVCNESTHVVKLEAGPGKTVVCEGADGGAKLCAPKVELIKKNQFIASGGVTIVYPGVAKVTGNAATGSLEKSADLKNFKITGGTHALIGKI
jgi:hypothetical protein